MAWRGTGLPGVLAPELLQPDDYDPADHQGQSFVETLALDAETIERGGFAITVGHLVKHRHQVRVRLRQIELEKGCGRKAHAPPTSREDPETKVDDIAAIAENSDEGAGTVRGILMGRNGP